MIIKKGPDYVVTFGVSIEDEGLLNKINGIEDAKAHKTLCVSLSIFSLCLEFEFHFRRVYWRNLDNVKFNCPVGDSNPCFSLESDKTGLTRVRVTG